MLLQSSQERIRVLAHPASGANDLFGLLQLCSDLYDEASRSPTCHKFLFAALKSENGVAFRFHSDNARKSSHLEIITLITKEIMLFLYKAVSTGSGD